MKRWGMSIVLVLAVGVVTAAAEAPDGRAAELEQQLQVIQYLPIDPLMVWAGDVGMAGASFDSLLGMVRRFLDDDEQAMLDAKLKEFDEELGFSLRDDLLAHLGPQMAAVADMPPIDVAAGSIMAGAENGIGQALGQMALWTQVDDPDAVGTALTKLAKLSEAQSETTDGVVRLSWPQYETEKAAPGAPPPPSLYYTIGNGILTVGFDGARVKAMLKPAAAEARLSAGDDFQAVLDHLDPDPRTIVYVNLPRLQQLIRDSQLVTSMAAANEEAGPMLEVLLDPELATSGIGATTRPIGSGVRQVAFGPSWMSGGASMVGIVTAIAVPNMLNAINRGRQKRTMAEIEAWAAALEAQASETGAYPATDGWADCDELAAVLAADTLPSTPAVDGWGNPLRCFSDGVTYRIVSGGKDGVVSGDYDGDVAPQETADFAEDIVLIDGDFVVYPAGASID